MSTMSDAMDLLGGLVMDGGLWGDTAEPWQVCDAAAVFARTTPMTFITRPRGGRKSADAAAMATAMHITMAPIGAMSYVVASDAAQAGLVLDSVRGLLLRQPALRSVVRLESRKVVFLADGERRSSLEVLPADEASSYGLRPWCVFVDELAVWPETAAARGIWAAIVSALPKIPDSRLVVLTSAGSPSHWSHKVLEQARRSSQWTVRETPGPLPWVTPEVLAEQQALLTPSQFARLHLNEWTAGEDQLTSPEQVRACVGHRGPIPPVRGVRYVHGLDVGLTNDRTVLTTAHADVRDGEVVVVVDRQRSWQGSKADPVDLAAVEAECRQMTRQYPGHMIFDPWQSQHLAQRLRASRIRVDSFSFTSASVGHLAVTMHRLLRGRLLDLPDDADLVDELASVVLRETQPGTFRIDTTGDRHDDRVVSLALCAQHLVSESIGGARLFIPSGRLPPTRSPRSSLPGSSPHDAPEGGPLHRGPTIRVGRFTVPRRGYTPPGRY